MKRQRIGWQRRIKRQKTKNKNKQKKKCAKEGNFHTVHGKKQIFN